MLKLNMTDFIRSLDGLLESNEKDVYKRQVLYLRNLFYYS